MINCLMKTPLIRRSLLALTMRAKQNRVLGQLDVTKLHQQSDLNIESILDIKVKVENPRCQCRATHALLCCGSSIRCALRIAARTAAGLGLRFTRSGVFTGRAAGDKAAERENYKGQFCKLGYFHGNSRKCGAN